MSRYSSPRSAGMAQILTELKGARAKHPHTDHTFLALTEEVGELSKAIQEGSYRGKDSVEQEAVQVIVVALRILTEGDNAHTLPALWCEDVAGDFAPRKRPSLYALPMSWHARVRRRIRQLLS